MFFQAWGNRRNRPNAIESIIRSLGRNVLSNVHGQSGLSHRWPKGAVTSASRGNDGTAKKTGHADGQENTHLELKAVDYMLKNRLWTLESGKIRANSEQVKPENFKTYAEEKDEQGKVVGTFTIPHCGCCSVMIHVLNLPFTRASKGKHNYLAAYSISCTG